MKLSKFGEKTKRVGHFLPCCQHASGAQCGRTNWLGRCNKKNCFCANTPILCVTFLFVNTAPFSMCHVKMLLRQHYKSTTLDVTCWGCTLGQQACGSSRRQAWNQMTCLLAQPPVRVACTEVLLRFLKSRFILPAVRVFCEPTGEYTSCRSCAHNNRVVVTCNAQDADTGTINGQMISWSKVGPKSWPKLGSRAHKNRVVVTSYHAWGGETLTKHGQSVNWLNSWSKKGQKAYSAPKTTFS